MFVRALCLLSTTHSNHQQSSYKEWKRKDLQYDWLESHLQIDKDHLIILGLVRVRYRHPHCGAVGLPES